MAIFDPHFRRSRDELLSLPEVEVHYIFYGIIEREVGCICCHYLAQSSGHGGEQLWHVVMVDHKVRHFQKSFVALKIRV